MFQILQQETIFFFQRLTLIVVQAKSFVIVLDVDQHKHRDREEIKNIHNHSREFVR